MYKQAQTVVYLDMVRVLTENQKANISEVSL